jgi:glycolate oxidase
VGAEGTLGVIVGATVRLRHLSPETRTITAFFPDLKAAFDGVRAVGRARIQPAIVELIDHASLRMLDDDFGSSLAAHGGALLLVQTDGHAAAAEAALADRALHTAGGRTNLPTRPSGEELVELRRHTRGAERSTEQSAGEDIAVPRSRLVEYAATLEGIATKTGCALRVVAHAGDGNLHPTFVAQRHPHATPAEREATQARLEAALDQAVRAALEIGGTITGEHGVGLRKLRWLPWEQRHEVLQIQRGIKQLLDPGNILNPGKAIA